MSMTINVSSYLSNLYQNTRTSAEEKTQQKEDTADVGKTQQSAVSASQDQVNMGQDGVAVTEVSRQQGTAQSSAQKQPAAPRMDTVEISAEGRAASQQQTADTSETEDLSAYTDTELKQMYYKGEITRQEYEQETGETLE